MIDLSKSTFVLEMEGYEGNVNDGAMNCFDHALKSVYVGPIREALNRDSVLLQSIRQNTKDKDKNFLS